MLILHMGHIVRTQFLTSFIVEARRRAEEEARADPHADKEAREITPEHIEIMLPQLLSEF